jgi:Abortive infection alpha
VSERRSQEISLRSAAPGLARIGAVASIRLVEWTATTYVRTGRRLLSAAASGEPPTVVLQRTREELLAHVRDLIAPADDGRPPTAPAAAPPRADADAEADAEELTDAEEERATEAWLRERGAELLRRSADLDDDEETHPAYARILEVMTPDEARILRFLALEGPQPSVDVRTGGPIGLLKDELIASGLNMIGMEAGVRHIDRVKRHLNNLYRLGLIWFSREELEDQTRYQVLEAQPDVAAALNENGRGRTVRRSIHLTPFGEDFVQVCLPLESTESV